LDEEKNMTIGTLPIGHLWVSTSMTWKTEARKLLK